MVCGIEDKLPLLLLHRMAVIQGPGVRTQGTKTTRSRFSPDVSEKINIMLILIMLKILSKIQSMVLPF